MSTAWMKATAPATSVTSELRADGKISADDPKPHTPQPCPICSETRGLSELDVDFYFATPHSDYLNPKPQGPLSPFSEYRGIMFDRR